ncbi:tRNA lysidine(34) synthetase TilS [Thioclava sp. GXIMD4215]|uniref:tRNA lysidine(34) synthetase TilS n=1 Tax=Thioclava sp. GXIMD4215 TaxID=3131928 RepID=UPI00324704EE
MSGHDKTPTAAPCRGSLPFGPPVPEAFVAAMQGRRVGLAVSGGGDSMAMLHLLAGRLDLAVVTVDHGLRPEAADEARMVGQVARSLGLPHWTLRWQAPSGGNLMDLARRARMELMGAWARQQGVSHIAMAHTADDQMETFFMRLARASGVQGLSGMRQAWVENGVTWHRPLLDLGREDLRAYLRGIGAQWAEDPSNDNPKYDRVKVRQAAPHLAALGITPKEICQTVSHLARAEEALSTALAAMVARHVQIDRGDVVVSLEGLEGEVQGEFRRRLFAVILGWIGGGAYAPRGPKLETFCRDLAQTRTLAGVQRSQKGGSVRFTRELAAVAQQVVAVSSAQITQWDRWRVGRDGPEAQGETGAYACRGLTIAALGKEGLAQCPDWRATGVPRASLLASPAVWDGPTLLAAPLAGLPNGWNAEIATPFTRSMLFTR